MEEINKVFEIHLSQFATTNLTSLTKDHLQNRVDTKFAFHCSGLPSLFKLLESSHQVLVVEGCAIQSYNNVYFDDERLSLYRHHHDKKANRIKVRLRKYANSQTVFFEVKQKLNKNRTVKQRIPQIAFQNALTAEATDLLIQFKQADLGPLRATLWCDFNRITLLTNSQDERMTIDYNINIRNTHISKAYNGLAIIEVKHSSGKPSSFDHLAKQNKIKKMSISKYVMGIAHLHPEQKQNNFRMKLLAIDRIMNTNKTLHGI